MRNDPGDRKWECGTAYGGDGKRKVYLLQKNFLIIFAIILLALLAGVGLPSPELFPAAGGGSTGSVGSGFGVGGV